MRIGLINIATSKYTRFLPDLHLSVARYFMINHTVIPVVLTDTPALAGYENPPANVGGACYFPVKHLPWPGPTLHRYAMIADLEQWLLSHCDYVFYCDVDMRFVSPVGDEILGDLVATLHPGFCSRPRSDFTYEHRPESLACVYPWEGERYYAGGFQGGKTERYLEAARVLRTRIDEDTRRGVTAVWHDESHWNRLLATMKPTVELDPGYCYPEYADLPFTKRLLALVKSHAELRAG